MENLWTIVLACASAIVLLSNAAEKIVVAVKAAKAPETAQNKKLSELDERLKKVETNLEKDKKQIDDAKNCNHVLTKGMLALLDHGINGNNIDQMKDARYDVETYLINH
jgi:hypothetical protein